MPNFLGRLMKSLRGAEGAEKLERYARWEAMRKAARHTPRAIMPPFDPFAPTVPEFNGHMKGARRIKELVEQSLKAAGLHYSLRSVIGRPRSQRISGKESHRSLRKEWILFAG